ncbi:oligosaccharyl transferase, archaeosortase A system-associated [Methanococcoides alaskense]|uniref:dolichyl-phosphooligosaccharide-protein glycotransferase n=1 Tax=Methanococcoides alaskense TaxID=325778 RepID=A0AA90ZCZ5_9EURY|nr:oligosaccharyl transferase, archaeosortase A system-associated [Methanococcoides alaskense]MDA0524846.1 oligosaccharyl transferase, archaeosortase A system-associated [Methanococcoides alaskense]MDR6223028.1 dolichyl-diphosphooligosaccharide--protein glycosyltransferase [Methanococcoides alaskense]
MTNEGKDNIIHILPYLAGVILAFLIALYIRTIPKASVFLSNGFVRFGGNDPWYHLRNVESIVNNFPNMLWFDAYTQYPNGTDQVFAPLFDLVLGTIIWILGGGNPSQDLIYTVSAYYPAFLGALVVVPTYFVAKWLFNRETGLLASLLVAISSGQFLSRSILGFNDHHIAETLLSTVAAMFLIIAIKKANDSGLSFDDLKNSKFKNLKPALPYLVLSGIALGAYSLAWKGALFFSFIIGVYIAVQHVMDHLNGRSTDYLAISGMVIFAVALIIVLLTPHLGGTKALHIKGLLAGIVAFPVLTGMSIAMSRKKLNKYYYPGLAAVLFVGGIIISKQVSPSAYSLVTSVFSYFTRTGGGLTIAEASPLLSMGGQFSFAPFWGNFTTLGYISLLAIVFLGYETFKKNNSPERTFLLVWTFMIIWAMLQQNRFAYYYSVNAAILSAYVGIKVLELAGWKGLLEDIRSKNKFDIKNIKIWHILSVLVIILVFMYPSYNMSMQQSQYTGGPNGYWIETTMWLNSNTPDPGLDYYESYEVPAKGESYQYPDAAYGVMSWWDYGHWIEVIGHRIPNANPFQQGVGGRRNSMEEENRPGASTFFTAQSEEEATAVLEAIHPDPEKAGARYIVSDVEMATGKFYAMAAWTLDTNDYYIPVQTDMGTQTVPGPRYFNSMESRLHIFDARGLEQYRMVYESPVGNSAETGYKNIYNALFEGDLALEDTGYVKIFEYVEGAQIVGEAPEGEEVVISTTIQTNIGRTFVYSQSTVSDGTYSFTVPYSTQGPIEGETQFDTMPVGPYKVTYGSVVEEVDVSERDVLDGNVIEV